MGHALNIVSYKAAVRQSDEIQSDREATEKELLASRTKVAHKSETRLDYSRDRRRRQNQRKRDLNCKKCVTSNFGACVALE